MLAGVEVVRAKPLELEFREKVFLTSLAQGTNQVGVNIEVILDRTLAATGHKEKAIRKDSRYLVQHPIILDCYLLSRSCFNTRPIHLYLPIDQELKMNLYRKTHHPEK
jgi:hypothetical protein